MPLSNVHTLRLSAIDNRSIFLDEDKPRIAFTKSTISIGCTVVDVTAARYILKQHDKWLRQQGEHIFQLAEIYGK